MAELLNNSEIIATNGRITLYFESLWFEVTSLSLGIDQIRMDVPCFEEGYATNYFEAIWNTAVEALTKTGMDTSVMLINDEGMPTDHFEVIWEDLIT